MSIFEWSKGDAILTYSRQLLAGILAQALVVYFGIREPAVEPTQAGLIP